MSNDLADLCAYAVVTRLWPALTVVLEGTYTYEL